MIGRVLLSGLVPTMLLFADFTYEQSSRISGGAMAGMMRVAGAFSKAARQPMKTTVLVKGDRMASITENSIDVIDLHSETFTNIDLEKKQYSRATFADMSKAMQKMASRGREAKDSGGELSFNAQVKPTDDTKTINGFNAKRTVLVVSLEGQSKKDGNTGAMRFINDMWMAPEVPGYDEVRNFSAKMAQKLAWSPMGNMSRALAAQQPGSEKAMAELVKEMSKLEGVPVLQVMRLGVAGTGMPTDAELAAMDKPAEGGAKADTGEKESSLSGAGRIGGALGGFGGFGRRKKQDEAPAQQQQASTNAAPSALLEFTTEMTNFNAGPVDESKFEVPAGFKEVEHAMTKMANR